MSKYLNESGLQEVWDKINTQNTSLITALNSKLPSSSLWHGTKEEYDALETKDSNTTYIITDEDSTLADYLLNDYLTSKSTTWSSNKINSQINDISTADLTVNCLKTKLKLVRVGRIVLVTYGGDTSDTETIPQGELGEVATLPDGFVPITTIWIAPIQVGSAKI